ncbi:NAD(P)H-hydrate epimerase [Microbacterium invictum]|uniref:NAD(P)H-hydrate epimerase n=1 Tax=Microbacterium invictum TaxID=515415 RepID=A0AA40SNG6_9MICO|nr:MULTISPECIES: NAD(P)H-hydrate epimerase [Microbacterium]MBB4139416.1 hydroxyethylthiazole kinase-like uncharacterized protein yjeF [Microbacterium invictum]
MTDHVRVPTYSAAQVRSAEAPLLEAGVPLMAQASDALARVVLSLLPETTGAAAEDAADSPATDSSLSPASPASAPARPRVLVLAGSGDNGADALFAAAHLTERADVDVILTGTRAHPQALAAATAAGAVPHDPIVAADYEIVVDGILGIGTGAEPALRGTARTVVSALLPAIRDGRTRVVAVDLPSGLQPDTGRTADDVVLPASITVTFGAVKTGLAAARGLTGEIVLVDLGLPLPDGAGSAQVTRFSDMSV